jgi:hypothetical protein
MALEGKYPDMDPVLKVLKNNEPELSAYLGDPETVCTLFIPSGKVRANMCSVYPGTSTAAVVVCAQKANQQCQGALLGGTSLGVMHEGSVPIVVLAPRQHCAYHDTLHLPRAPGPCCVPLPSQAFQDSVKRLGKYAGKAAQNRTLGLSTLNYHIVPGQVLTAAQIGSNITRAMTRANETIYFWREK